jgi:hypothetical protein
MLGRRPREETPPVEKVNGEPWAIEFATFNAVRNPLKEAEAQ